MSLRVRSSTDGLLSTLATVPGRVLRPAVDTPSETAPADVARRDPLGKEVVGVVHYESEDETPPAHRCTVDK